MTVEAGLPGGAPEHASPVDPVPWVEINQPLQVRQIMAEQYSSAANEATRAELSIYRLHPRPNVHEKILTQAVIDLHDDDVVLDVGCSTGRLIRGIRDTTPAAATFLGIDISDANYFPGEADERIANHPRPVYFHQGTLNQIPLPDGYVSRYIASSSMFLADNTAAAFEEARRVLRPDGYAIVTTFGGDHSIRRHQFERELSEMFDIPAPPVQWAALDHHAVIEQTQDLFEINESATIKDVIVIQSPQSISDYITCIKRSSSLIEGTTAEQVQAWRDAADTVVLPKILAEIEENGAFLEQVEQHYFFMTPKSNL